MNPLSIISGQSPSTKLAFVFGFVSFVVLPSVLGAQWTDIVTSTTCFAIAAAGIAFLYGRVGMVSLTQVGLMGVGGWIMLRLSHGTTLPFEINLILAAFGAMGFGVILSLPSLRLRGLYLALITLMAAGGFEVLFAAFQFPNGGDGFWGVQTATEAGVRRPAIALSDSAYLRYVIGCAILGFLLIELNRRLKPGRAWAMLSQSEAAAMSASINVVRHKIWAFALSGFLAGIAGALLAGNIGLLDPSTFRAGESILLFALVVVGGSTYWLGCIIAAVLYRILPALLNDWGLDPDLAFIIFGIGLLHALITAPKGIASQILDRRARVAAPKEAQQSIEIADLNVRFGGVVALDNVSVTFDKAIVGIIGPNGAGKTTLMNAISGFIANTGTIQSGATELTSLAPHKRSQWGLRRSFQREELSENLSIFDNVLVQLDADPMPPADKQAAVHKALAFVDLQDQAEDMVADLGGFERRLVDLAKCVAGAPRVILLDEPAGGMSSDETRQLADLILAIKDHCGAQVLLIDHDVDLVAKVCEDTMVLDFGRRIAMGPTAQVLNDPAVVKAYLGSAEE